MPQRDPVIVSSALFTAGITAGVGLAINLQLPSNLQKPGANAFNLLKSLTILSQDNLPWDVWFYSSATHYNAGAAVPNDSDTWIGHWSFGTGDAATPMSNDPSPLVYKYFTFGNDLALWDDDQKGQVHLVITSITGNMTAGHGLLVKLLLAQQYNQGT